MADKAPSIWLLDERILDADHLRLLAPVMAKSGEAAQVLAAFILLTDQSGRGKVFASLDKLAEVSCVSKSTVRRSIASLVADGWLVRVGRERAKEFHRMARRTVTYALTMGAQVTLRNLKFLKLSRPLVWAFRKAGRPLSWSERAILAAVISRHTMTERMGDELGGADTSFHSIRTLARDTGLSRRSVQRGFDALVRRGLIVETEDPDPWPRHRGWWVELNQELSIRGEYIPRPAMATVSHTKHPISIDRREGKRPPGVATGRRAFAECSALDKVNTVRGANVNTSGAPKRTRRGCQCEHDGGANVNIALKQTLEPNPGTKSLNQFGGTKRRCEDAAGVPSGFPKGKNGQDQKTKPKEFTPEQLAEQEQRRLDALAVCKAEAQP